MNNQPPKYNTKNLNINLITSLDLSGVVVIENSATGATPVPINPTGELHVEFVAEPSDPSRFIEQHVPFSGIDEKTDDGRYTKYTIDPKGELFGNTSCGLNNYVNYMVLTDPLIIA